MYLTCNKKRVSFTNYVLIIRSILKNCIFQILPVYLYSLVKILLNQKHFFEKKKNVDLSIPNTYLNKHC